MQYRKRQDKMDAEQIDWCRTQRQDAEHTRGCSSGRLQCTQGAAVQEGYSAHKGLQFRKVTVNTRGCSLGRLQCTIQGAAVQEGYSEHKGLQFRKNAEYEGGRTCRMLNTKIEGLNGCSTNVDCRRGCLTLDSLDSVQKRLGLYGHRTGRMREYNACSYECSPSYSRTY